MKKAAVAVLFAVALAIVGYFAVQEIAGEIACDNGTTFLGYAEVTDVTPRFIKGITVREFLDYEVALQPFESPSDYQLAKSRAASWSTTVVPASYVTWKVEVLNRPDVGAPVAVCENQAHLPQLDI